MYVTLPSNSSPDYYPENKISDYIVHLPKELQLLGSWEVGLAEIQFNHSLHNVDTTKYWVIYKRGEVHIKTKLPSGYYQEPKQLIRLLLNQMKHDFQAKNEELVACRASHFIELPCQTSFCLFYIFFISLLSVA